jgi:hypothetical protein
LRDTTLGGVSGVKYKAVIDGINKGKLIATSLSTYTSAGLPIPFSTTTKVCDFASAVKLGYDVYTFSDKYKSLSDAEFKTQIDALPTLP